MKKLRIAQVTNLQESVPPKGKNGLEQVVSDLTEELVKMGHEVTLFATADSKTSAKLVPIWPTAFSRDKYGHLMDPRTFATWSVAEAYIRHAEFDIIHSHAGGFIAGHFAGAIPTPVVATIHSPVSSDFLKQFPPEYLHYFETIEDKHRSYTHPVAVSQFQASILKRPTTVITNGIPLENWDTFNSESGEYFAFLGYMTPDKGAAEAVQAILKTNEKLVIAGSIREDDPRGQSYFEERIKPYIDDNKIKFVGVLTPEEKIEFYKKAKATLMPIQWDEPFGLVAIESMVCGTPVIAWNRAAMPEIIEEGVSGFLVNSVEEMTERINQVAMLSRQKARARVEAHFTAEIMAKKYVQLYEDIIAKKG
jgi:glycosyltransferase involved in cell wall biosynthesis